MTPDVLTCLAVIVIGLAAWAVLRGWDVRLVMFVAGCMLGSLAGNAAPIVQKFFATLGNEQFVVPICSAMGFAYVLRESGCDRHLVLLLVRPVRSMRPILIPAAVGVGFFVNIAVISQASTAVAVGTVLIPLMRSAGLAPSVIGAALLLGASLGGELLNPGAPELQSVAKALGLTDTRDIQPILAPILAVQLIVATGLFWFLCRNVARVESEEVPATEPINLFKAIIPIVPVALLLCAGPPFHLFHVPEHWLIGKGTSTGAATRLIGVSMIFGSTLAVLASPRIASKATGQFFTGAGYAFASIVSIIATANCFGDGVKAMNLTEGIGRLTQSNPGMIWPLAAGASYAFAWVCGSGMATTESLYRFFMQGQWAVPANLTIGSVVSISAAAGRTSSPAAAVVLLVASLVEVRPVQLLKLVTFPLVAASAASAAYAAWSL
ncbi:MAG: C4-dicarboxylate transporter DcuC [Gemmataceae bacterium]|nr:C4-dicarboxylate transporter DcuC [Gemmataceae bacterium]